MQDKKPFIAIGAVLLATIGIIGYALNRTGGDPFANNTSGSPAPSAKTTAPATPVASVTPFIALPPHTRGNQAAAVLVEEFGDYQCPACAMLFQEMEKIEAEYAGRIRFSFSHFPIVARHPYAIIAARAAEAAGVQGKFWEMHKKLYEHQKDWGFMDKDNKAAKTEAEAREIFVTYANELKLDVEKFKKDWDSPESEKQVTSDQTRGTRMQVAGTPSIFMSSPQMAPNQLKPEMMTPEGIRKALDYLITQSGGSANTESKPAVKTDGKAAGK
jgi:protein-disulfide isomerase